MELKKNMMFTFTCAILLLLTQQHTLAASTETSHEHNHDHQRHNHTEENNIPLNETQTIQRRQGFDFMSYFMNKNAQQQQQQQQQQQAPQQQEPLQQQPSQIQQQHLLQQQILQEQQRRQLEQLQQLQQQQQLIHHQQQQRTPTDLGYQDNGVQQQYQPQTAALNREGGYVSLGVGNGYSQGYAQSQPREIGINIGGKPVVQVGSILQLLPRIFNVLSAGGKVMFGVELGNNFYFGPVGAKPLG